MGVMTLAAETGSVLTIKVDGQDEQKAIAALVSLVNNKFNED